MTAPTQCPPIGICTRGTVSRHMDGDTLELMLRAFTFPVHVRLNDCWAPEKHEEDGKVSAMRLAELLPVGAAVNVFVDTSQATSPFDVLTFNRLLAYLWVRGFEKEPPINLVMVREGFATKTKQPKPKRESRHD